MVGGNLVRKLLERGESVRALIHHDRRALEGLDVETTNADLTDLQSLQHAFEGASTVYHLASSISINQNNAQFIEEVNLGGTQNVIQACLDCGVNRMVYFSSIHAYQQNPLDQPLDESRPLISEGDPSPYIRTKAAAERLARQAPNLGLDTVIVIPTAIVGPNDFGPSYLGQALRLLAKGYIPALVRGGYDWVDVRDVVDGAIQAAQIGKNGERYILSGHWHSLKEFARTVSSVTGKPAPPLVVPIWLAKLFQPAMAGLAQINQSQPLYTPMMLDAMRSNRDIRHTKAARELGYTPRSFEKTIHDTVEWFNLQGGNP